MSITTSPGLSSTPTSYTQAGVAPYAQPFADQVVGMASGLLKAPMPQYTGELAAGPSDLQSQAWQGLANLSLPSGYGTAASNLGNISQQATNIGSTYNPVNFTNTYNSPGAYQGIAATNQYTPTTGQANVNYTNQFTAPEAYNPITASTQNFDQSAAQQYMNPYLQASLSPQLQLLQNQLGQQNAASNAQLAQAGAYGGGRQAIVNSQNALNSNLAANQLISSGYNTAYNNAMNQFNADQARQLQAQQANIGQQEFGAGQSMTAAEQAAQYGQSALGAQGAQQQFNLQQQLANAQNQANYGNQAQQANIQQAQFGTTTGLTEAQQQAAALQAQQAAQAQQAQYQSNLGLQGLQLGTTANQALTQNAQSQAQQNLADLNAQAAQGQVAQQQQQAADTAAYNQYLQQLQYPQTMLKEASGILSALPATTSATYGALPSLLQSTAGTVGGISTIANALGGGTTTSANGTTTTTPGVASQLAAAYNQLPSASSLFGGS
jgi:hypothetical protein